MHHKIEMLVYLITLTLSNVLFTLTNIHVDEFRTLHTENKHQTHSLYENISIQFGTLLSHCTQYFSRTHLRKVMVHSVATALASRVFPVPGGP